MSTLFLAVLALSAGLNIDETLAAGILAHRQNGGPAVELWTNRDRPVDTGAPVRVYFRSRENGYVTVFRADTDGRIEVLFPTEPWDNNYARGGRRYEIRQGPERYSFLANGYPGQGYLFAVASRSPFNYRDLAARSSWDYRSVGQRGRIVGDPYIALMDLIDLIVPANYVDYDYDVTTYHVEDRFDYPRFLCYDCHDYVDYDRWNPYADPCFRFRLVAYADPYYYPAREYDGTRVVFSRPRRLDARYVFVDRDDRREIPETRRDWAAERDERRATQGATSRDFGGVGRIPAPVTERRRSPEPVGGTPVRTPTTAPERRGSWDEDARRIVSELRRRSEQELNRGLDPSVRRAPARLPSSPGQPTQPTARDTVTPRDPVVAPPVRRTGDSARSTTRRRVRPDTSATRPAVEDPNGSRSRDRPRRP